MEEKRMDPKLEKIQKGKSVFGQMVFTILYCEFYVSVVLVTSDQDPFRKIFLQDGNGKGFLANPY